MERWRRRRQRESWRVDSGMRSRCAETCSGFCPQGIQFPPPSFPQGLLVPSGSHGGFSCILNIHYSCQFLKFKYTARHQNVCKWPAGDRKEEPRLRSSHRVSAVRLRVPSKHQTCLKSPLTPSGIISPHLIIICMDSLRMVVFQ